MDRQVHAVLAKIERRLAAIEKLLSRGAVASPKRSTPKGSQHPQKKLMVRKYV